jgi:protein TonB
MPAPEAEIAVPVIFEPPAAPALPVAPQMLAAAELPTPTTYFLDPLSPIAPLDVPADPRGLPPRAAHHRDTPGRAPAAQPITTPRPAAAVQQTAGVAAPAPGQVQAPAAAPSFARALQAWEASVHQAVQNALVYPNAARLMRREGRTRVRFDYGHKAVSSVSVVESSGLGALDRAALDAVLHAAIPPPPPELSIETRPLILWVNFSLTTEE